jgi:outer membrane protein OmpA-like peptidoglycan-associated protein
MTSGKNGFLCLICFLCALPFAGAAEKPSAYTLVERSDFSRYDNGKYIGHVYREVRAAINPEEAADDGTTRYHGNYIVMEETLRDMRQSARAVNAIVSVNFALLENGGMQIENDRGYPVLKNFPVYDISGINSGSVWTANGSRAVDPLNDGQILRVPFTARYEYKGIEDYRGVPCHRIEAEYETIDDFSAAVNGGGNGAGATLSRVRGKHEVTILLAVSNGILILSRDNMDETFSWNDGKNVRYKGFTLSFGQGLVPLDTNAIKKTIEKTDGLELEKVDGGLRLSIRDLQFRSDSAELLPEETPRLDLIAESLAGIEGRTFLVEGHTASTGQALGEQDLSAERAKAVVDELVRRGIPAGRFIYKGWGATKALGDNSTPEGRRANRRVEITILE